MSHKYRLPVERRVDSSGDFMNRVYRLVWSDAANAWVAVAESARGRGKGASRKLMAAAILLAAAGVQAAPAGGQVTSGAAAITQSGLTTTIKQTSQNLSLNWKSFNVGAQETVNFVQPSASAIAVNRIYDTNGSQIMGRLNANGQVYLVNPNGILFGQGAQINVGGLVASTLDIQDASLNSSARSFSGNGPGRILNLGTINTASGGYVALLGNQVSNQGAIVAQLGSVVMGGGSAVTLNFNGNSLLNMVVDQSVLNSLAENGGLIKADGGMVMLSAGAKDTLLASMVNNTGDIEAHTIVNHEGKITLLGGMAAGTVNVAGTLDASAPNGGNGGFIETSAAHVTVADAAKISTAAPAGLTGTWLIDPIDFTIAAGNAGPTNSGIGASTLSSNLVNTSVSIATDPSTTGSGDIFVNSAVSWSANKLTLSAHRNININANLNGSGTASLALEYGMGASNGVIGGVAASYNVNAAVNLAAGPNLSTKLGSSGALKNYTVITSLGAQGSTTATDLQGMQGNLTLNYALGSNIDASATTGWNSDAGFKPVGYASGGATTFTGIFDGLGHTISNLTINRPGTVDVGLFGAAANYATISNVGLLNSRVLGGAGTGSLLGTAITASISNSYNTGTVSGAAGTGGLAGVITTGGVSGSYNTGTVSGAAGTGGLIGVLTTGSISDSYSMAAVTGNAGTGGLAGAMTTGSISNSFSTGNVDGNAGTGGLAGGITTGNVSGSYTTGNVKGDAGTGGLAGTVTTGSISDSYTTGNVLGAAGTGGLAGVITTGNVSSSFTTGTVTGAAGTSSSLAGTVTAGSISNSFAVSAGQPIDFASFSASSASGKWVLSVSGKPVLKSLIKTFTITANDVTQTYNGLSYSGGNSVSYSDPYQGYLTGTLSYTGTSQTARNAGSYGISAGGLSSTNSQYVVLYVGGTLTISKANLTLSGTQVYNGSTAFAGANLSAAGVNGETFAISGTGNTTNLNSKNVQSGITLDSVTGLTVAAGNTIALNTALASNYNALSTTGSSVNVTAANLILSSSNVSKTYDAGLTALGTAIKVGGLTTVNGDTLTGGTFAFTDKNVGNGDKNITATGVTVNDGNGGANYNVSYAANTTSTITQASLTVSGLTANDKIYNASTTAVLSGTAAVSALGSDVVTVSGSVGTFDTKNVGTNKNVTLTGATLAGADALNYSVTNQAPLSATITRLNSVAWIGGATGNWFDTANWQGGAVPDLSNVANVSIPAGVNVNFNNANASSVLQGGLVQVDSIGNLGALNMAQGSLNVANNLTLAALTQSGGALGGTGNVSVNSFNQSGGFVLNTGNFSVTNAFTQTGTGIVAVGGNIAIAQLSGDLNTSSLSGNNINLTANNGAAILGAVNARGVLSVNAVAGTAPAPAAAAANLSADIRSIGLTLAASASASFSVVSNSASLAAKNSPEASVAVNTSSTEESSEVEFAEN